MAYCHGTATHHASTGTPGIVQTDGYDGDNDDRYRLVRMNAAATQPGHKLGEIQIVAFLVIVPFLLSPLFISAKAAMSSRTYGLFENFKQRAKEQPLVAGGVCVSSLTLELSDSAYYG